MEDAVRSEGAVPATIAILRGVVHIGLSDEQLVSLAMEGNDETIERLSNIFPSYPEIRNGADE